MNTQRMINMVLSDLAVDSMKEEDRIEVAINSSDDAGLKLTTIKSALGRLVMNEAMITKFQSMIEQKDTKTIENG